MLMEPLVTDSKLNTVNFQVVINLELILKYGNAKHVHELKLIFCVTLANKSETGFGKFLDTVFRVEHLFVD